MMKVVCMGLLLLGTASFAEAQIRKIPSTVTHRFEKLYPGARTVEWKDEVTQFQADFTDTDGRNARAEFSTKGVWKMTETDLNTREVPEAILNGMKASKYADWALEAAEMLSLPGGKKQYRLKVGKNDLQKKYLTFNEAGRLLKDAITI